MYRQFISARPAHSSAPAFTPKLVPCLLLVAVATIRVRNDFYAQAFRACRPTRISASRRVEIETQSRRVPPLGTPSRFRLRPFAAPLRAVAGGDDSFLELPISAEASSPLYYNEDMLDGLLEKFAMPLEYTDRGGSSAIGGTVSPSAVPSPTSAKSNFVDAVAQNKESDAGKEEAKTIASPLLEQTTSSTSDATSTQGDAMASPTAGDAKADAKKFDAPELFSAATTAPATYAVTGPPPPAPRRRFSDFGIASEAPDPSPSPSLVRNTKQSGGFTSLGESAISAQPPSAAKSTSATPTGSMSDVEATPAVPLRIESVQKSLPATVSESGAAATSSVKKERAEPAKSNNGDALSTTSREASDANKGATSLPNNEAISTTTARTTKATTITIPSTGKESGMLRFKAVLEGGYSHLDFGLTGVILVGLTLYLVLAAWLKSAISDEGYAGWDDFRPKAMVEEGDTTNEATPAIAEIEEDMVTKEAAPRIALVMQDEAMKETAPKVTKVEEEVQPTQIMAQLESLQASSVVSKLDHRLSKVEQNTSRIFKTEADGGSLAYLKEIEEFCESGTVNTECSESLTYYLDSLSTDRVEPSLGAKTKIISYLDSLHGDKHSDPTTSSPSKTGAAFSSYLDALSSGTVPAPPSAGDVAGYLDVLSAPEGGGGDPAALSSKDDPPAKLELEPVRYDETTVKGRISDVETRLSQLEDSVASLPDDIASRLMQWQTQQDKRHSDEIQKITAYLIEVQGTQG